MRVFWFTNVLIPEAASLLGLPHNYYGGWMCALLEALRAGFPDMELYILTSGGEEKICKSGNVTYATFVGPKFIAFEKGVPSAITRAIMRHVDSFNPDIIHIHGTENYYAQMPMEAFSGKPVLVSLQAIINGYYPHYNGGLSLRELRTYRNAIRNVLKRDSTADMQECWRSVKSPQERDVFRKHRFFAGRTEWDRAWLYALNPEAKYYTLEEALRPEIFSSKRGPDTIKRYSIYCGAAGSYPLKGLHWLLRAMGILAGEFPDATVRIADSEYYLKSEGIIGRAKAKEYHRYLRSLICELGLEGRVTALPMLDPAEVVRELESAHVFCLPSLCENSPNSLGEAMLVGAPCVSTFTGGTPSILEAGREGILCPPGDPASLAFAIRKLFKDDSLAAMYSSEAKARATRRYDPTSVARSTEAAYRDIVATVN